MAAACGPPLAAKLMMMTWKKQVLLLVAESSIADEWAAAVSSESSKSTHLSLSFSVRPCTFTLGRSFVVGPHRSAVALFA